MKKHANKFLEYQSCKTEATCQVGTMKKKNNNEQFSNHKMRRKSIGQDKNVARNLVEDWKNDWSKWNIRGIEVKNIEINREM